MQLLSRETENLLGRSIQQTNLGTLAQDEKEIMTAPVLSCFLIFWMTPANTSIFIVSILTLISTVNWAELPCLCFFFLINDLVYNI